MEKISFGRKFLNAILTFLFTLLVFAVIAIGVMNNTLFSPDFYIRQIDKIGFSEIVLNEMQDAFNSYTSALNLPDDFVTDRISTEQIDEAIKQTIAAEFNNTAPLDYSVFTDQLVEGLQNHVETELGIPVDLTALISGFDTKIEEIFDKYFATTAFSRVAKFVRTYGPIVGIGQWIFGAAALIILTLILRLSPNRAGRLRNLIFSFSGLVVLNGTGLLAKLLPADIFLRFLNMNLAIESVRLLVTQCINSAFSAFTWPLIVSAAILVVLVVVYCVVQKNARHKTALKIK